MARLVGFGCSTVCPILLGLMGVWRKLLAKCARWWNTEIKVNPSQVREQMGHPVELVSSKSVRNNPEVAIGVMEEDEYDEVVPPFQPDGDLHRDCLLE